MHIRNRVAYSMKKTQNQKKIYIFNTKKPHIVRNQTLQSEQSHHDSLELKSYHREKSHYRKPVLSNYEENCTNLCLLKQRNSFPCQQNRKVKDKRHIQQIQKICQIKNIEFMQVNTFQDKLRQSLSKINSHHIRRRQPNLQCLNINSEQFYFRFSHKNQENTEPILQARGLQVNNPKMVIKRQEKQRIVPFQEPKLKKTNLHCKKVEKRQLAKNDKLVSLFNFAKQDNNPHEKIQRWDNQFRNSSFKHEYEINDLNIYCGLQCFKGY